MRYEVGEVLGEQQTGLCQGFPQGGGLVVTQASVSGPGGSACGTGHSMAQCKQCVLWMAGEAAQPGHQMPLKRKQN